MLVVVGLVLAVALRPPTPGWPPNGWVLAACDVGQGDALLLHVSPGAAVLVDAGPDPRALARCLDRFDIDTLPLVVLTHYHADHVAGLAAAAAQREVGAVLATGLAQPAAGAADVRRTLAAVQLQPVVPQVATTWSVGEATLQLVGPARTRPGAASSATSAHEEGSDANNASLVLLVALRGLRILLTGDAEPPAQAWLARALMGQRVDVLKVPHHGSRYQDLRFLTGLAPAVSLISVGVDNGYGHPSAEVMDALEAAGSQVLRTDRDGDLVVIVREGQLTTMTGS